MSYALWSAAILVLLTALGFFFLFRGLLSRQRDSQTSLEWCSQFSVAKYRPMERLFSDEDYEFLSTQPGYSPQIMRKLQAERRKIFRHYLRALSRDFDRLHTAAKFLILHAPEDQSQLIAALFRQKLAFRYAVYTVRCRLALQAVGLGKVDIRGLVAPVEAVREQLRLSLATVQQRSI